MDEATEVSFDSARLRDVNGLRRHAIESENTPLHVFGWGNPDKRIDSADLGSIV
ncbi:MAG: hypothetical protein J2P54_18625 [Bradyrhizobiaceae bacterium]|nr:hypothetical protein [Bradyrhizobiaceae bacterium]